MTKHRITVAAASRHDVKQEEPRSEHGLKQINRRKALKTSQHLLAGAISAVVSRLELKCFLT